MSRKLFAIVLGCALLAPAVASAHTAQCSPGFWKTHIDDAPYCDGGVVVDLPFCNYMEAKPECCSENLLSCEEYVDLLTPPPGDAGCPDTTGDGLPDCDRHVTARFLNSCFNIDFLNPCPEE